MPGFRTAWLMVFVALVALNLATIKTVLDHRNPFKEMLLMGALPMANVLVIGLLIGYRCRKSRRFILGFEAFGAMALSLFIASIYPMISLHYRLFIEPYGMSWTHIVIGNSITVAMIGSSQLAFALLGGFLSRKFGIVERPD